ncbi:aminoglycoside phosphotransferase family protein [Nocardioides sp.]|uniref:phosphotransferase family protein n=1 Tax=Nocardioides sp. TaxID=35761 RepID=UPI002B27BE4E|nr:aminoglycoside phosphotransferase family protein [Nocardioides sp.]
MSTSDQEVPIVSEPEDLTPEWLTAALGRQVDGVEREQVGTGQIGTCFRLTLTGDSALPETVLAKLPAADPAARALVIGAYAIELRFYREIAPTVAIKVPIVHHQAIDEATGAFTLLMEDLAPAVQGDQVAGCTPEQARDAAINLAGLHGPRWCDPTLADVEGLTIQGPDDAALLAEFYGPALEIFVDGLGHRLESATIETLRQTLDLAEAWTLGRSERFGLVHGDYRLDNLMFDPRDGAVTAVDWQTLSLGLPARDLAFLAGTGLSVEHRRTSDEDVVTAYHAALLGHGVSDYSLELAFEDYRFAMMQGALIAVFGCAYGTRTERGDTMFAAMVNRSCAAMRDLGTLDLVGESA